MKKAILVFAALLGLTLTALAPAKTFLTIGSGGYTGTYYPVAVGIAKIINTNMSDIRANAISTGGSLYNVIALETGSLQLAMAQNDTSYYAYTGTVIDKVIGRPTKRLRGIASLYTQPIHIIARRDSKIESVADMRGRKVYVGDIGSGTEQNTKLILKSYGMGFDDLAAVVHGKAGQAVQMLVNGDIDAMFFSAAVGSRAFVDAAKSGDVVFLSIDQEHLDKLQRNYPFYSQLTVPAGTYPNQEQAFTSIAVHSLLVTTADLSEDLVYRIAKLLFVDKAQDFKSIKPVLEKYFDVRKALEGMSIPIHKGAAKLYQELGVPIPDRVAPID
ncbi:TAXI family TRAP transporter solute-binding subunit [Oceanithermus sp.]|uniref:TAXI family TRAP transporter solute-binding subunit n=1 Tax=Oceanithermus sp. TaxID=2268145 RepID=UPI0025E36E0F|nr:TAXI family TRAP transporter solute-binding subunit [Oceanithermus sp.]